MGHDDDGVESNEDGYLPGASFEEQFEPLWRYTKHDSSLGECWGDVVANNRTIWKREVAACVFC